MNRFLLGSGFFDDGAGWASWFHSSIWLPCASKAGAERIKILAVGDCIPSVGEAQSVIRLSGNCGHVHQQLRKMEPFKEHRLCGWSAALVTLAMLAYSNETDLIFLEQDCVAFGPWVDHLYSELGDGGMIFGGSKIMPCAQSLVLIKHEFIVEFVIQYLTGANETRLSDLPEMRFKKMLDRNPGRVRTFSFGVDRERPLPIGSDVWYAQKLTREELLTLRTAGLLRFEGDPPMVETFTGKS